MRKILFVGSAILLCCNVFAQPVDQRNYVGLEAGLNYGWMGGAENFYFIFSDPYVAPGRTYFFPQPFEDLGGGLGVNLGATVDLSLSKLFGLAGKVFYTTHNTSSTDVVGVDSRYFNGNNGPLITDITLEDNYEMNMSYFGASIAGRIQFAPESWYGKLGLSYAGNMSADFSGYQRITSGNFVYVNYPSGGPVASPGDTEITILGDMSSAANSRMGLDIGVGTWIKLGGSDWVITPELSFSIPITNWYTKSQQDIYNDGNLLLGDPDPTDSDPNQPFVLGIPVTTPSLWNIALTVGIKFPWGGNSSRAREGEKETILAGHVRDLKTKGPIDDAEVVIIDLATNEEVDVQSTDASGSYGIALVPGRYSVTAQADEYLFNSTYFEVNNDGKIVKGNPDIYLEKPPAKIRLLVFFDFNKADLKEESNPELKRAVSVMKKNPTMEVEIAGHTDNVGSDQYNKELSQQRANAVLQYLAAHGVGTSRLTAVGYGESQPVDSNESEDGRAANRRVEFIVKKM